MILRELKERGFECQLESHAGAILEHDFPDALSDISSVLQAFSVPITEIIGSGGGEAKGTQRMRKAFANAEWGKKHFEIRKILNGVEKESTSHEVDHAKKFANGEIALELEWNNKDPFFDRDLENFKRLHSEGAISLGVIVTRGASLHARMGELMQRFADEERISSFEDLKRLNIRPTPLQCKVISDWVSRPRDPMPFSEAWRRKFVADKYAASTTNWLKLIDRVQRGVGNPCPLLLIGLPESIVTFPPLSPILAAEEIERAAEENAIERN